MKKDRTTKLPAEKNENVASRRAEMNELFQSFFDDAPIGKSMTAPDGRIIRVNKTFGDMLGYAVDEMQDLHFATFTHPDDVAETQEGVQSLIAGDRDVWIVDKRYVAKNGGHVWAHLTTRLHRDAAGEPVILLTHIQDITAARAAEEALRQSEERFRRLFEDAVLGLYRTTPAGDILMANPALLRMLGYDSFAELKKRNLEHDGYAPEYSRAQFKATLDRQGVVAGLEARWRKTDGSYVAVRENARVQRAEDGRILYYEGTVEDITELKRVEEALRHHREHLEELVAERTAELAERNAELRESEAHARAAEKDASAANKAKSEFLASMSHEFRTPLHGILGFADILAGGMAGELTAQQRQYLQNISLSGQHLLQLINDMLDLAKVEAGKMALEPTRVALDALLVDALSLFRAQAAASRVTLSGALSPELRGQRMWADERKIRQVLWNLLSNALKFTPPEGAVELRASQIDYEIVFAVSDTGIGISAENQRRIFNAFEQVRQDGQSSAPGVGLGLALSRRLVELHGGSIWVESRGEGYGSAFYFSIPANIEKTFDREPDGLPARGGIALKGRVLVVEDDDVSTLMLNELLTMHGARVAKARSAEDALRLAKTEHPDAIVMDIGLPGMDGLEATRILKADPETTAIPVIVLTSYAMPTDVENARAAGCDFYVAKPMDVREFLDIMARILEAGPGRKAS